MNYYLHSKFIWQPWKGLHIWRALAFVCFAILGLEASAQTLQVTGQIVSTDGEQLIGVNILNENSSEGTATDIEGRYSIEANVGDWFIYSYIGYTTERQNAQDGMIGDVFLTTASDIHDEVI